MPTLKFINELYYVFKSESCVHPILFGVAAAEIKDAHHRKVIELNSEEITKPNKKSEQWLDEDKVFHLNN